MSENVILTSKHGRIGTITLNRPEDMNTFTIPFAEQLDGALWDMENDPQILLVLIKANGKNFSTGISLDQFDNRDQPAFRKFLYQIDAFYHTLAKMKTLTMSVVNGYALANGAGLAFATDLTVASETASFGTTAINVGLICLGPAAPMMRIIGRKKTMQMVLTGEIITAEQALNLGLISKVVVADELDAAAQKLADKMVAKSPLALQIGKEGINRIAECSSYDEGLNTMDDLFATLCASADATEGVKAFLEKRAPQWQEK